MLRRASPLAALVPAALAACATPPPPAAPPPPPPELATAAPSPRPAPPPRPRWENGPSLVIGDRLVLYDLEHGRVRADLRDPDGVVPKMVSVGPKAEHVAVLGIDGTLTVWRTADGAVVARKRAWASKWPVPDEEPGELCEGNYGLFHVTWSPSGATATVSGTEGSRLLDLRTGALAEIRCRGPGVCGEYADSGDVLALHFEGIDVVRPPDLTSILSIGSAEAFQLGPGGRLLAVSHEISLTGAGAGAELWDVTAKRRVWVAPATYVWAFGPRGRQLLGTRVQKDGGSEVVVLDARTGAVLASWAPSSMGCGGGLAWGRDGVAVSDDGAIRIWRERRGARIIGEPLPKEPGAHPNPTGSCEACGGDALRLSPDGETLASTQRLWSWSTGKERTRLAWACDAASHVGWSDDGRYLAMSGRFGGEARLVAFRASDGSIATERKGRSCGSDWIPGTHAFGSYPVPASLAFEIRRADDGAVLWLVPGVDRPIAAIASTGEHDGTPMPEHLPEGVTPRRACEGLAARFVAGGRCP